MRLLPAILMSSSLFLGFLFLEGDFTDNAERYKDLKNTSLLTILLNALLSGAKLAAGLISGSSAVLSDAAHSLSDVLTTIMVIVGLRFSSEEADREHPYGHQRIESVVSLLLAAVLAATALSLGYSGVMNLIQHVAPHSSVFAYAVTLVSIASKEWMFRYTRKKAKKHGSSSMLADAWHHRTDSFSSIAVLFGLIGVSFGLWYLDACAAIAVCLIILKAAFDISVVSFNQLVDRSADKDAYDKILSLAVSVEGVRRVDLLRTRLSSRIVFVELEITVDPNITVFEGHKIAKSAHDLIESCGLPIGHCMVHVNPDMGTDERHDG